MKKLILATVLLLVVSVGYSQETTQSLQLTIKSDKEIYSLWDDIELGITYENVSDEAFYLCQQNIAGGISKVHNLIIKDASGKRVNIFRTSPEREYTIESRDFWLLEPHKGVAFRINGELRNPIIFTDPYKNEKEAEGSYIVGMETMAFYVAPGKYEIRYSYTNNIDSYDNKQVGQELLENVWTGTIISNPIYIEVLAEDKPVGILDKNKAIEIAEKYFSKKNFKDLFEKHYYRTQEFEDYIDVFFRRKKRVKLKGDGIVRVYRSNLTPKLMPGL